MAMPRLHMNEIREIFQLRFDAKPWHREIGVRVGRGRTSVEDCLRRFADCGLIWPLPVGRPRESAQKQTPGSKTSAREQRSATGLGKPATFS